MVVWVYVCLVGLFSFGACCVLAGLLWSAMKELQISEDLLTEKVNEFDDIMKRASKANNSQAEKIVELTTRVENLEGWRSMVGISESSKKKWTN